MAEKPSGGTSRTRADRLLTELGLAPSRQRAQALILAGKVFWGDRRIEKAGDTVPSNAPLTVRGPDHPYVSRGGVKLAGALDALHVDAKGAVALDVGASTGGFTDCLLQRGASRVYAVDVGYGQLDDRLRRDDRVVVLERVNARELDDSHIPEPVDLVTIDVSFISVTKILPAIMPLLVPDGQVIVMVKPQFELGKDAVGRGGVVRDPQQRSAAADKVVAAAATLGLREVARADSVLAGPKGNVEIFVHLARA